MGFVGGCGSKFFLFGRKGEGGEGGKGADAGISASTGTFQILLFALIALKIKSNAPGYVLRGCGWCWELWLMLVERILFRRSSWRDMAR